MNKKEYKQLYVGSLLEKQGLVDRLNAKSYLNPYRVKNTATKAYENMLIIKDRILCSNRYINTLAKLTNLTSQQLESFFWKYASLCFYNNNGKLGIARYAQQGALTELGRLSKIKPIDFGGNTHETVYDVIDEYGGDTTSENIAVIINDYTGDYQMTDEMSRYSINRTTTIADQSTAYNQLRINLQMSIKKCIAICNDEEQRASVIAQANYILDPEIPIIAIDKSDSKTAIDSAIEMFNLDNKFDSQNYCQTIDYYDKIRRKFNGIKTPDTFEKKERKITSESENDNSDTDLILLDGYLTRFYGYELVKKYLKIENIETLSVKINPVLMAQETEENDTDNTESNEVNNDNTSNE